MSAEAFADLKASLLESGLQNPIILDEEGLVLDGWNRHQAIRELAAENEIVVGVCFETSYDPVATIKAHHLARRTMTEGQRAEAVVKMYKWVEKQENLTSASRDAPDSSAKEIKKKPQKHQKQVKSTREMAKEANVSEGTIRRAQKRVEEEEGKTTKKPRKTDKPVDETKEVKLTDKQKMAEEILRLKDLNNEKDQKIVDLEERIAHMEEGGGDSKVLEGVQEQLAMMKDKYDGCQRRATQLSKAIKTSNETIAKLEERLEKYEPKEE